MNKRIKDYIYHLFMVLDLDYNGYLALKKYEQECFKRQRIIPLMNIDKLNIKE